MMPFTRSIDPGLARFLVSTCRGIAVVAALFCIAIATLLVANTVQMATVTPQESPALSALRGQYQAAPDDELAGQIRALDLAARRTYFTRQWQNRTAAIMLIAGAALLVACLRIAGSLSKRLPKPLPGEGASLRPVSRAARIALTATGLVLLAGALAAAVIADRLLPADPGIAAARAAARETRAAARAARRAGAAAGAAVTPEMLANWPQFRGPGGNGIAGQQDPPTDWDGRTGRNIAWTVEVPLPGNSSPVAWGDRVFLTGADAKTRAVYCWNARTGEHRWHVEIPTRAGSGAEKIRISDDTGWAAPTPAVDGKAVYAVFPTGDLVALDLDGNPLWNRFLGVPVLNYGYASSLALLDDMLLVQLDQREGGRLIAIDTATGKDRWSIERTVTSSWASPVVADTTVGVRVFLNGTPTLTAYDPARRRALWAVDGMMGENGPSPAYADGRVFAANQLLSMVAADAKTGEKLWDVYEGLPEIASPVAGSGFVVMAASFGTLTALDPADGTVIRQHEVGTGFSASPIIAGGRVYALDKKGVMRIFSADRAFDLLASPGIGEPTVATPAFVAGAIFIRGERHLFCIRGPGAAP
jgi:outer membrane protein assembly factor BamB